ncbi:MAG: ATPase, T2SS/T4P/T4SS family [Erysipelotrichaceae bacterium]
MSAIDFKFLNKYVLDDDVTDINYNGKTLWIDHLQLGRYRIDEDVDDEVIETLCFQIANYVNLPFNNIYPILEAQTDTLRLSILHPSIAKNGYSISIRKTLPVVRLNEEMMVKSNYCNDDAIDIFKMIIKKKLNILICGLPGSGKTELVKFLGGYILSNDRVISIEDTLELRYNDIYYHKDNVSLQVNNFMDYSLAIKTSLRQRPNWLLVSEVRSKEVLYLMQAISTGASMISTIHCGSSFQIPQRLLNMFGNIENTNENLLNMIYENIDIVIHIVSKITKQGIIRYIDEIVVFNLSNDGKRSCELIYDTKGIVENNFYWKLMNG